MHVRPRRCATRKRASATRTNLATPPKFGGVAMLRSRAGRGAWPLDVRSWLNATAFHGAKRRCSICLLAAATCLMWPRSWSYRRTRCAPTRRISSRKRASIRARNSSIWWNPSKPRGVFPARSPRCLACQFGRVWDDFFATADGLEMQPLHMRSSERRPKAQDIAVCLEIGQNSTKLASGRDPLGKQARSTRQTGAIRYWQAGRTRQTGAIRFPSLPVRMAGPRNLSERAHPLRASRSPTR